ncbi:MAG: hypothetical protein GQ526_08385 [Ardenticatenales bacterium]|jgi:hypothetical protein|nr:hypothetical protein [Ardenticatenales bacterium]
MLKKIVLGGLLVGLIGTLIVGGVIRTADRLDGAAEASGQGNRRVAEAENASPPREDQGHGNRRVAEAENASSPREGQGQGNRRVAEAENNTLPRGDQGLGNQGEGRAERGYPNYEDASHEWMEIEGTVVQVPDEGVDLVIDTREGDVHVGTGPGYLAQKDYVLQTGESIRVVGYWEDGEFKAAEITRTADGATISLRDEVGRPAWAGQSSGRERDTAGGGGGQADVEAWIQLQGTVVSVDIDTLLVELGSGEQVSMENRAWWFALEQGFSVQAGDQVILSGFYEGEDLEVGRIENLTSGQSVLIREQGGRPMWAGGGRRGNG